MWKGECSQLPTERQTQCSSEKELPAPSSHILGTASLIAVNMEWLKRQLCLFWLLVQRTQPLMAGRGAWWQRGWQLRLWELVHIWVDQEAERGIQVLKGLSSFLFNLPWNEVTHIQGQSSFLRVKFPWKYPHTHT